MAVSSDQVLKQQLLTSVQHALSQQIVDANHCLLIRFYSNLATVNSKAHQAGIAVGALPARDALVARAALHMFAGETEGSYFIAFSEDIAALLHAIEGIEVAWGVRSIVTGSNPQFFGKKGMEKISQAPARFIGIFKVNNANIVKWSDADLRQAVETLRKTNPEKYMDLKKNFQAEHEVVAYYPGPIEAPVAQVDNPFYPVYMSKV